MDENREERFYDLLEAMKTMRKRSIRSVCAI